MYNKSYVRKLKLKTSSKHLECLTDLFECLTNVSFECLTNVWFECLTNVRFECLTNVRFECLTNVRFECLTNVRFECLTNVRFECLKNMWSECIINLSECLTNVQFECLTNNLCDLNVSSIFLNASHICDSNSSHIKLCDSNSSQICNLKWVTGLMGSAVCFHDCLTEEHLLNRNCERNWRETNKFCESPMSNSLNKMIMISIQFPFLLCFKT